MTTTFLLLFTCIFLTLTQFQVNALACYKCQTSADYGFRIGGSCFSPDKTTEIGYGCKYCSVDIQEDKNMVRIERRCGRLASFSHMKMNECSSEKLKLGLTCHCNGTDFCNDIVIPRPKNVIDCYKCNVQYRENESKEEPCYKPNKNTPIQKDCLQCTTRFYNNSRGFQMIRGCSIYSRQKNECSTNKDGTTECYCDGKTLCNKLPFKNPLEEENSDENSENDGYYWSSESSREIFADGPENYSQ